MCCDVAIAKDGELGIGYCYFSENMMCGLNLDDYDENMMSYIQYILIDFPDLQ